MNTVRGEAADFYATMGRVATIEVLGITAETTDDEIMSIAAAEEAAAEEQGQIVDGISDYLFELRDSLRTSD